MKPASAPAVSTEPLRIDIDGVSVSAAIDRSADAKPTGVGVVMGHGAGGDMNTKRLVATAEGLAARGHTVLRFNFPYRETGRKSPDPAPRLERAYEAAVRQLRGAKDVSRLFFTGHSMGGRIGTHLAARGEACDGVVLFGYPLHPAGGGPLRDAHLPSIRVPVLFVQGTRDALCELSLLRPVLAKMGGRATLYEVEGADHSLEIKRSSGKDPLVVREGILTTVDRFLRGAKPKRK